MASENVLLFAASPRKGGNTDTAAATVGDAVAACGGTAEPVHLHEFRIERCTGCLSCQLGKRCAIRDDFQDVWRNVKRARKIVFFIPVYWCSPPGLMKDFIDRTVVDFQAGGVMAEKEIHLVSIAQSAGWEPQEKIVDQWVQWLGGSPPASKMRLIAFHKGELAENANAIKKLKKLGRAL